MLLEHRLSDVHSPRHVLSTRPRRWHRAFLRDMWDRPWLSDARRSRLGSPHPRDRDQPLEGFAGPPLSQ
eukprot:2051721-Alexandrium_andersonii.AAC.1